MARSWCTPAAAAFFLLRVRLAVSLVMLPRAMSPRFDAAGKQIAYFEGNPARLMLFHAERGKPAKIAEIPQADLAAGAVWCPDGRSILVAASVSTERPGVAGTAGVAVAARIAGQHGLIPPDYANIYGCGHTLTYAAHRLLTRNSNAREFTRTQISKIPHPKGKPPQGDEFPRLQAGGFKAWSLKVDGMINRPSVFSMAELRSYPRRSQITQLICEEGWSYIAEWNGVPLSHILDLVGVQPAAKYAVYYSMDGGADAIDMNDAWHGQTLISYGMNGGDMPVGHGGPLRLRVPRSLRQSDTSGSNGIGGQRSRGRTRSALH